MAIDLSSRYRIITNNNTVLAPSNANKIRNSGGYRFTGNVRVIAPNRKPAILPHDNIQCVVRLKAWKKQPCSTGV